MDRQQAIIAVRSRVRDFHSWSGGQGYRRPDIPTEEDVKYLQECFPVVKSNDPSAWEQGGWKRVELDEALQSLGFSLLKD